MKNKNKNKKSTALVEVKADVTHLTPSDQGLAPLELSDYSQFLYATNYGGKARQDFTAGGIKTIVLQNGISTGDVKIEFLNDEKTIALFYCTATDRNGNTSERVVKQRETENGRINPHWIEKGIARVERNAIKTRLTIQLFKITLQKAIKQGEAKQSAIVEAQRLLGTVWAERDECLGNIDKKKFYAAAQVEYGDAEYWDADTWHQVIDDLKSLADWVKSIDNSPF